MTNGAAFLLNETGGKENHQCHLSHIQQEDLEEEAQSGACDLIGSSADGITQLAPKSETVPLDSLLKDRGDVSCDSAADLSLHGVRLANFPHPTAKETD